ncbi:MAG: type 2 isopentenyl-diphosphate Delta-isomerase [Chloroflexota bacterium]
MDQQITDRKAEHIAVVTGEQVEPMTRASWEDVLLVHSCLPEIDLADVSLEVEFLGRRLAAPVLISSMTGGHALAEEINAVLAEAAQELGLAMGVGSQRAYVRNPALADSYAVVRKHAPSAFIVGNVGAPQLIAQGAEPAMTLPQIRAAIELIQADALAVHLNYLQETVQPEGDTRARGVLHAIGELAAAVRVPVIAKETGAGIAAPQAMQLKEAGVRALDVGGLGGTSFAMVEAHRARISQRLDKAALGELFSGWGIPTAVSVVLSAAAGLPIIGSGGIRSGLDAARALALGADLVGVARPLLLTAQQGAGATVEWLERFLDELRTAMFLTGSATVAALRGKAVLTGVSRDLVATLSPR